MAVTALTMIAHGSAGTIASLPAASEAAVMRLATQSTAPAAAGTEMLSSRRTGIVSTSAAVRAARIGAAIVKVSGGNGETAGRTHQASATPASAPNTTNAT